jgi:hypothetical protein
MIPFLKNQKEAGVSQPIETITRESDEGESTDNLEFAMEDLSNALKSGDHKAAAEAFRAAFDLLEKQPHSEDGEA